VNGFDKIRDWIFDIRFTSVIVIGFSVSLLFPFCANLLGEGAVLIEYPFFGAWLVMCALVVARAHRTVAHSSNSLLQFGGPVAAGFLFASLTICVGAVGFWLAAHVIPAGFR